VEQIRKVGGLLSSLGAPFLVLADSQSEERDRIAGRVPADGSKGLNAEQWKQVAKVVAEAAQVTEEFGLDLVFHPHVSTYVETAAETEKFFDVTSGTKIGLCLDTGHCDYAGDDCIAEAEKYRDVRPPWRRNCRRRDTGPRLRDAHRGASFHKSARPERGRRWRRWDVRWQPLRRSHSPLPDRGQLPSSRPTPARKTPRSIRKDPAPPWTSPPSPARAGFPKRERASPT
jgi:hypothetical protein